MIYRTQYEEINQAMSKSISPNSTCPCLSGKKYKKCCRPYHSGMPVPAPEALVRARFAAYALGNVEYIMQTTYPDSPHYEDNDDRWLFDLQTYMAQTTFLNLDIVSAENDSVTYQLELTYDDKPIHYIETSTFAQVDGKWRFVDSTLTELE